MTNAVSVRGLTKRYGARTVLDGVSFEVARGAAVAIVGPSGGGKSTLVRCMVGLEPFEQGAIVVAGAGLAPGPSDPRALAALRTKSGLVFQQFHLFGHLTVLENVTLAPMLVRKLPLAEARARAVALLERVGLAHRIDARPLALSGGEQQRCAIARALAMEPDVLFLDEPTSALDPRRVAELAEWLTALRAERGLTLVTVTHELGFASSLADELILIADGRVAASGPPRTLLDDRRDDPVVRRFLGR